MISSTSTMRQPYVTSPNTPSGDAATLLHDLISQSAQRYSEHPAAQIGKQMLTYRELDEAISAVATGLVNNGLLRGERVAIYLPKSIECVTGIFGTAAAGGVFVPINPILKAQQVQHILRDSGARVLLTSASRLSTLEGMSGTCPDLKLIVLTDESTSDVGTSKIELATYTEFCTPGESRQSINANDLAAIFYTSGSTGLPKGVMLSHRNIVTGAVSVSSYLENTHDDCILAVLPFSFDAGFSQLTTGFHSGATVVMLDYLLPGDVGRVAAEHRITGITGVPPLWSRLAEIKWPDAARKHMRYFATTGGVMPRNVLDSLRTTFPHAKPFLMYGLTEAFRSTYLAPNEIDRRPDSIGKAIPNAEVLVLKEDGTPCEPGEIGELVHCGPLVALGYWQAPARTAKRFRPVPGRFGPDNKPEIGVWSGDSVLMDADGFLYFKGRRDEMIKTSGYRVSPSEIEESIMTSGLVTEIVALGLPDEKLGQFIVVVAVAADDDVTSEQLFDFCRNQFPLYMLPAKILWQDALPRNANGKFDRVLLKTKAQAELSGE
jgi:acyl-CoA ligase (AMP-forming) (exosortase A-associated)